jgi:hypothetical protein
LELTNQLLEADGDDQKFFKPALPYQKRAWACYELGLHAEAAKAYEISTMLAKRDWDANIDQLTEDIYEEGNALGICAREGSAVVVAMQENGDGAGGSHMQFNLRSRGAAEEGDDEEEEEVWMASGANVEATKSAKLEKNVGVVRESATVAIGRLRKVFARGEASEAARMGVWAPVRTQAKLMLKKTLDAFADKPDEFGITREIYIKISTGKDVGGTAPATGIAMDLQRQEEKDTAGLPNLGPVHTVGLCKLNAVDP